MVLPLTCPSPTTAERIRSACVRAGGALLALETVHARQDPVVTPVHHLLPDGSFALALPSERDGQPDGTIAGSQALLELTDYAPLPLREPVRSLVWVRGRLQEFRPAKIAETVDLIAAEWPHPALLQVDTPRSAPSDGQEARYTLFRLEIASVVVTDATGAEPVSVADLLAARPDPFCEIESNLLWHLDTVHSDVVARLVSRLPAPLRRGQVRPLGLDRYGVRFRVEGADRDHDVRLPFHKPVDDMTGLSQAIRVLMGCPFINGLRARQ
ncbi:prephenate dehydratase [Mycobacterium nebraskense]|uniref:Prephenate dehydratase n=1 Tax=Mycobacterium nebraskense TaxID=244292 RepID=A0A1X1ZH44_9MYCO|nr:prephenate dehydratase [Mycobacterium nebraskense]